MPHLHVIGVGVGDPQYLTLAAIEAIKDTSVFFVIDKGEVKADLTAARQVILDAHARPGAYRVVTIRDPARIVQAGMSAQAYAGEVKRWRDARLELIADSLTRELAGDSTGAFLVWGDPSLYDGTLRILDDLIASGMHDLEYDVIPGISSLHALTARHRTLLNRVGGSVLITTGRQLARGWPSGADDVLVMLDSGFAARAYAHEPITVYWGAYLGTADELLIAGPLAEVADEIERVRTEARERKGWIMDTYLLRRGKLR